MNKQQEPRLRFKGFTGAWEENVLEEVVNFFSGLTYSPNDVVKNGTLVLRSSNVQDNQITTEDNVFVKESAVNCQNVEVGDVIVVVRNGSRSLIGKHAIIKEKMPNTVIGAFMTGVRSNQPDFLNALLDSYKFNQEIEKNLGATINQITTGAFRKMEFSLPSLPEQTHLGLFFRRLDSQIAESRAVLEKSRQLKKAMLAKMFPANGEKLPKIRFKGFEGEWERKKLGEIAFKVKEKNIAYQYAETFTNSAEFGIISQQDFFDKSISNSENIGGYYVVQPNDFVYNPRISSFAPVGPIKRNKLGRTGVMSPLYYVFRLNDEIKPSYLEQYFEGNQWHHFMYLNGDTGARSDRFSIKNDVFAEMPISFPTDKNEQTAIGLFFRQLDETIALQSAEVEKLNQLKKGLLAAMLV